MKYADILNFWRSLLYRNSRVPGFDEIYYLYWYRDVADYNGSPLAHYLNHGWRQGRDPSASFSTLGYLLANPDVAEANVCPLLHFWKHGLVEGRAGYQKHPDLPAPEANVTAAVIKAFQPQPSDKSSLSTKTLGRTIESSQHKTITDDLTFNVAFRKHLLEDFYAGSSEEFLESREFANAWKEHAWDRTDRFGKHMLPWILDNFDLNSAEILEIGCGTGAITAVLQPHAKTIRCWEPDAKSLRAARKRTVGKMYPLKKGILQTIVYSLSTEVQPTLSY